ncbi:hypothetical protein SAMN04489806_3021 [Paramicrobacterium humi]|uniref:Uncharacterized protein n=1 Tax=Paramicrobacterium humi TaxID=640635 RepID=A0A1H4R777_9MICO|nr:hypothetical protein [Microbacterium humi]SEC27676.1 hypothetical protein SAMN04489806_3021 [Microbacterium humi]
MASDVGGLRRRGVLQRRVSGGRLRESFRFAELAALTVGFAGLVMPVIGWLIGLALVFASPRWYRWEKFVALVVPGGLATLVAIAVAALTRLQTNHPEFVRDALPSPYDVAWVGITMVLVIGACVGLWLFHRIDDAYRMPPGSGA